MSKPRLAASLLVDDGSPVNLMVSHHPGGGHRYLIPHTLTVRFASLCRKFGVRGKFSIVPMPLGLGRLDGQILGVPPRHLARFRAIARKGIAPNFDITPELLTHLFAINPKTGGAWHLFEDLWVEQASVGSIADLLAMALVILKNAGLPANGVTSPWMTGENNEADYAQAIGQAQWLVHRRKLTWYMLHVQENGPPRQPVVTSRHAQRGQNVVMVPANTGDLWWNTQFAHSPREAKQIAADGLDKLLSADGRSGRLREVFDAGGPLTILTHWQSLFSNGSAAGLWGLEQLLGRMKKTFGSRIQWVRCSELARRAAANV
ncbi:MAG: hypothetical protein IT443_09920 [Phycisphaeraceae bacterium]|nr:hypothetical protein [Phycisphaeraceae bacterium]